MLGYSSGLPRLRFHGSHPATGHYASQACAGSRNQAPTCRHYLRTRRPAIQRHAGLLGLQHAAESASKVTLPVSALLSLGLPAQSLETMIVATLLVSGLCCLGVSGKPGLFGFGHLAPVAILSSFVAPALLAARAGGLPLVAGMGLITGIVVAALSRVLHRWRFLFPPEVVGLIAFMVGASQSTLAVRASWV